MSWLVAPPSSGVSEELIFETVGRKYSDEEEYDGLFANSKRYRSSS